MFGSLEDIIWTNIDILTLHCDLELECSYPTFLQDTLANDDVSSDQVWLPKNRQFWRYGRKSHIWIIWAFAVTLKIADKICFLHDTLAHDVASPHQVWL